MDNLEPYLLGASQRQLWFLSELAAKENLFNMPYAMRIKGDLQIDRMRESFQALIERHEMLRNVFYKQDGQVYQRTMPVTQFKLPVADIWENDRAMLCVRQFTQEAFDLQAGLLIRAQLFRTARMEYLLVIVIHHLVADGWSIGILLKELQENYRCLLQNLRIQRAPLPIRYRDYLQIQQARLHKSFLDKELQYWRKELRDCPDRLNLPFDFSVREIGDYTGSHEMFRLSSAQVLALRQLANEHSVTMFILLLTIFNMLLYQYTSQNDILIGVPTAGRDSERIAGIVGMFISTQVVRTRLTGDTLFTDLLASVRNTVLLGQEHNGLPFDVLVSGMKLRNNNNMSPLFQVMFSMQTSPMPDFDFPALVVDSIDLDYGTSQYGLSCTVWQDKEAMKISLEYDTSLWKPQSIQRMGNHYINLVDQILGDQGRTVSGYDCVNACERATLIEGWNNTDCPLHHEVIQDMIEWQASRTPANVAIRYNDELVRYDELTRKSNQWCRFLQENGVEKGTLVGVCLSESVEYVVCLIGILKAGAVYIPIDKDFPDERIAYIICDSALSFVITDNDDFVGGVNVINCLAKQEAIDAMLPDITKTVCDSTTPACLIYTSGSTGNPKGIPLHHGGICNLIASFLKSYDCTDQDRLMPITALSSSSFVGEVFPMLCCGGSLILSDKSKTLDLRKAGSMIQELEVTIISTVPSFIVYMNTMDRFPDTLRLVLCGGEALYYSHIDHLPGHVHVVNAYGLTETTVCNTYSLVLPQRAHNDGVVPIGKPVINTKIYILNDYMQCVPVGVYGQIYVSGIGLSAGYLNNVELTKRRFIENPFVPGQTMFATGDIGRWIDSGVIEYVGRFDNQVQIRGYRVELEEIERKICDYGRVADCLVKVVDLQIQQQALCAYLVPRAGYDIELAAIQTWMIQNLPRYMHPDAYYILHDIPLLQNGKADRKYTIENARLLRHPVAAMPGNGMQRKLLGIWQDILNNRGIGINDNFFDVGGNSLLTMKVQSEIMRRIGLDVSLIDLYQYPTISLLSGYLLDVDGDSHPLDGDAAVRQRRDEVVAYAKNKKRTKI